MNYLHDLPDDLKEHIYEFRDNEIVRNVKIIQRAWLRYDAKMWTFIEITEECYFWSSLYPTDPPIFQASDPTTASIIEFLGKRIKKTDKIVCSSCIWNQLFNDIYDGIRMDMYSGGQGAKFYNRTETAFYNILTTLDLKWKYDNEPEYFT